MQLKDVINSMELRVGEDGETKLSMTVPKDGLLLKNKNEKLLYLEALELLGSEMDYKNIGLIKKSPDEKN